MLDLELVELRLLDHLVELALQRHERVDVWRVEQVVLMHVLNLLRAPLDCRAHVVLLGKEVFRVLARVRLGQLALLDGQLFDLLVDLRRQLFECRDARSDDRSKADALGVVWLADLSVAIR